MISFNDRRLDMTSIRALTAAAVGAGLLLVTACGSSSDPTGKAPAGGGGSSAPTDTIVVGSANFQENVVLADIYAGALKAKGVKVSTKLNIGSRETYIPAVKDGSIDLIPEYSGVLLQYFDKGATAVSATDVFAALQKATPQPLMVLTQSAAEDKDAIVVTKQTAAKYNLKSIADLAPVAGKLTLGAPPEFQTRADGIPGLQKTYGVKFKTYKKLDAGGPLTENALKNGQVDAGDIFTTDPLIAKNGWVVLEDPKNLYTAQNVLPLINSKKASANVKAALAAVSAKLTTDDLVKLNEQVSLEKQNAETVAQKWLADAGLA
jgi:osmoprotectant transport system substrate-binding protein